MSEALGRSLLFFSAALICNSNPLMWPQTATELIKSWFVCYIRLISETPSARGESGVRLWNMSAVKIVCDMLQFMAQWDQYHSQTLECPAARSNQCLWIRTGQDNDKMRATTPLTTISKFTEGQIKKTTWTCHAVAEFPRVLLVCQLLELT